MGLTLLFAAGCLWISDAEVDGKVGEGRSGERLDDAVDDTNAADSDIDSGDVDADGDGYTIDGGDCDDKNSATHPGTQEVCDGFDDDCDGGANDVVPTTWYVDYDGDGHGSTRYTSVECQAPLGYVESDDDCDDTDAGVNPGTAEACDGLDQDCDGAADDGFDADGDGLADCFDQEECDGFDNDGDGVVDEDDAVDAATWYGDSDGDGYGDSALFRSACTQPAGSVTDATDCDDGDASSFPGAAEACDAEDDDCDGRTDNDAPCDFSVEFNDDPTSLSYGHA